MTGPPAAKLAIYAAPPTKRADPQAISVRLHDGTLIAHVGRELAVEIAAAGNGEICRRGPRQYLRLRQGIKVPRPESGWPVIEFLRKWLGDKRAAGYVAHKDQESQRLRLEPRNQRRGGRS